MIKAAVGGGSEGGFIFADNHRPHHWSPWLCAVPCLLAFACEEEEANGAATTLTDRPHYHLPISELEP